MSQTIRRGRSGQKKSLRVDLRGLLRRIFQNRKSDRLGRSLHVVARAKISHGAIGRHIVCADPKYFSKLPTPILAIGGPDRVTWPAFRLRAWGHPFPNRRKIGKIGKNRGQANVLRWFAIERSRASTDLNIVPKAVDFSSVLAVGFSRLSNLPILRLMWMIVIRSAQNPGAVCLDCGSRQLGWRPESAGSRSQWTAAAAG